MNLPNTITLSRIPLMFVIVWLMYEPWPGAATLAFSLFVLGAVSDWYDGYLARRLGIVSTFGKFMDALSDKIFVLGIMVAQVDLDGPVHLPVPFVLITLCREFLVSGMRMAAASKGVVVPADRGGKTKTVSQLIAIGLLLGASMLEMDITRWTKLDVVSTVEWLHEIGLVFFIIGTCLAVWSGWRYIERHKDLVFDETPS